MLLLLTQLKLMSPGETAVFRALATNININPRAVSARDTIMKARWTYKNRRKNYNYVHYMYIYI